MTIEIILWNLLIWYLDLLHALHIKSEKNNLIHVLCIKDFFKILTSQYIFLRRYISINGLKQIPADEEKKKEETTEKPTEEEKKSDDKKEDKKGDAKDAGKADNTTKSENKTEEAKVSVWMVWLNVFCLISHLKFYSLSMHVKCCKIKAFAWC